MNLSRVKLLFIKYFPIIAIFLLATLFRLLWVDKIPNAIGGDELTYTINAKSMFLTGTDISGTWLPITGFIFQYPAYTLPQAELPYFLLMPIVGLTNFSLFNARITFVFLSILAVILTYLTAKELFGKKEIGIIAGLIAAINPWMIYIGRTAYEGSAAMLFYLLSLYLLLKLKGWKILLSIPFLFCAFYAYIGTKIIFIPFLLISIAYVYFFVNKKRYLRQYCIVFLVCFLLVGLYALSFVFKVSLGPSRLTEILTPGAPIVEKQVNMVRKVTIASPLTSLFENKLTMYVQITSSKFLDAISFSYWFNNGDTFFSLRHGLFYLLDAIFLVFGFAATYAYRKRAFFLLLTLSALGIVPQIIHANTIGNMAIHITLAFPFLVMFIAVGIWEILTLIKNKYYFLGASIVIVILYTFFVFNFLNVYFFQFPLQGNFDFHVRLFSKYIDLAQKNNKMIIIYSPKSTDIFKKYLFYTNNYNRDNLITIRSIYKSERFSFENLQFKGCNNTIDPTKTEDLIVYDTACGNLPKEYPHRTVPRLADGGESYKIYNDNVCTNLDLKRYPMGLKVSDFDIEKMGKDQFCKTFITSL